MGTMFLPLFVEKIVEIWKPITVLIIKKLSDFVY
jgi:hypothetical protein